MAAEGPGPASQDRAAAGEDETGHCSGAVVEVPASAVPAAAVEDPAAAVLLAGAAHSGSGGRRPEAVAREEARGFPRVHAAASRGRFRVPSDPTYIILLRVEFTALPSLRSQADVGPRMLLPNGNSS
ncbi:hypothetical protein GCM10009691_10780 [Brevibacterium picturae]|uniref:Uncharacterized protein n=1 Tax=Brevibacterium picturae TaxID=260553 RepID=A0ABN2BCS2_9MICO